MSQMIVKEKLSKRAVMKGLGRVHLQERRLTQKGISEATTKSKSRTQTITKGHVG